ncbi:MAG: RluA family pseudouridine synthase [Candidatus Omnitrophica bacterium]|nr:RluA family pseudouridine synthase [Candidatus Omnitrophota bacterium]MCM8826314.1 RluA family pseudouridine synthase [Candidatus Omnitrophota bacterium]
MGEEILSVLKEDAGKRLDKFISQNLKHISRTKVKELITQGNVLVNGMVKKTSYIVKDNDNVCIRNVDNKLAILEPYPMDINILCEDDDIIVVNKPQGLVVHPPNINYQKTLVNVLVYLGKNLSSINPLRPGVVHRLDKETSGVMVLAKNNYAHLNLVSQFRRRMVKKEYRAIVWGVIEQDSLQIDLPIKRDLNNRFKMRVSFLKSKEAKTFLQVIERFKEATYIKLMPITGRMHQIRVHLKFLGFPIIGDEKYGRKDGYKNLFLHSYYLSFSHPRTEKILEFTSSLPKRFKEFIDKQKH